MTCHTAIWSSLLAAQACEAGLGCLHLALHLLSTHSRLWYAACVHVSIPRRHKTFSERHVGRWLCSLRVNPNPKHQSLHIRP